MNYTDHDPEMTASLGRLICLLGTIWGSTRPDQLDTIITPCGGFSIPGDALISTLRDDSASRSYEIKDSPFTVRVQWSIDRLWGNLLALQAINGWLDGEHEWRLSGSHDRNKPLLRGWNLTSMLNTQPLFFMLERSQFALSANSSDPLASRPTGEKGTLGGECGKYVCNNMNALWLWKPGWVYHCEACAVRFGEVTPHRRDVYRKDEPSHV